MSFFDEAKHKLEEVVGKIEETVGGAMGDKAMEFHGKAHEMHGEAMQDEEGEAPTMIDEQPNNETPEVLPDAGPQDPERLSEMDAAEANVANQQEAEENGDWKQKRD